MSILLKLICRFSMIHIKIPASFFVEIDKVSKSIRKLFIWNFRGLQIAKTLFENNKVEGLSLLDFKTYDKTTVIKLVEYWYGSRISRPMNRLESQEINHPPYLLSVGF